MRFLPCLAILVAIGSCAPAPKPVPLPVPPPHVPVPVVASPYVGDWRDWPVMPGDWVYRQDARGSIALFGVPGQDADFSIRCDRTGGQVYLSRKGTIASGAGMTVRTSSAMRSLASVPTGASQLYMASALTPRDNLLDAMGYSRGRFVVEQAGMPVLVIPAWAEVLRVAEDCR